MGSDNKRPPSTRNGSPISKRQRVDRSAPASAAPSPVPTDLNSPSTSRNSTPALEHPRRNGRSRTHGTETPAPEPEPEPEQAEDDPPLGDDDHQEDNKEDDQEPEGDGLAEVPAEHHTISAKTLPDHQPRPGEGKAERNGGGNGRPTVGGKGQKGEEALEHAVAAREQVERRRVEYREENIKTGQVPKGGVDGVNGDVVAAEDDLVKVEEGLPAAEEDGPAPVRRERPAITEERDRIIQFRVVTNDGDPASLIILTGLKNIFQKQLPKMPREYIARLVFDRNHYSMAIVKRGLEVVGGITYRPFEARQFAEIVFCAITGTEQVKGYGSHLMNHLKDYVKKATSCMHFLTYADNYAIGYFKKQGFTKEITLDRSVWAAYIKDYEGGTIMHCAMLPRIEYLKVSQILAQQKEVVLREIQQRSRSHIVHPGLDLFLHKAKEESLDPSLIPGLKESGWTPEMDRLTRRPKRHPQFAIMQKLHTLLNDHPSSWAFANPVNAEEVTDYYDRIKEPMDFSTMAAKLEGNAYKGTDEFVADARLIFDNCRAYNALESNYVKNANKLEAFLNEQVALYLE